VALETRSGPAVPAAPLTFSTTKFCFRADCSRSAVSRATTSAMPPGANGVTMVTVRSG
jgi:hypothetical protein